MTKHDYIEFQDRSTALGYLITFRCYGTWLHGDERGSMDRRYFNRYGGQKITPSLQAEMRKASQLKNPVYLLGAEERSVVRSAVEEVCAVRGYNLYALHVRTNHAHVVTGNHGRPERTMDSFKAYSTRALRSGGRVDANSRLWSRHGSTRYLWTEEHIHAAVDYVLNGQGNELPDFD